MQKHFKYVKKKVKAFPYSIPSVGPGADPGVQAVSLQVTVSHPPGGRLHILSARPAVTFPAAEHHRPLAGTKLYCLVTEAHGLLCSVAPSRICTRDLLIASPMHYPLRHRHRCTNAFVEKTEPEKTLGNSKYFMRFSPIPFGCSCATSIILQIRILRSNLSVFLTIRTCWNVVQSRLANHIRNSALSSTTA